MRCEFCLIRVKFQDNSEHLKECPKVKMSCDLCSLEKYRKDIAEHFCSEKIMDCSFVQHKCLARTKQNDIDTHLEEKGNKHLELKLTAMEDLITKQSETKQEIKNRVRRLTNKTSCYIPSLIQIFSHEIS